jgi:AcrR family transcriptional regulator
MMKAAHQMKISELSERSNVSPTTIRYYIRRGLLPKPAMFRKTMAYYTPEHLKQLAQISMMKGKGLSLEAIWDVVHGNAGITAEEYISLTNPTGKKEAIINSAIELFREKGYNLTTIGDIVRRARIGKVAFYHFFKGKEDLFFDCAESVFFDIGRDDPSIRDEQDGQKRLWNRAISFFQFFPHMIDMLNLLRGASIQDARRLNQVLSKVMENLIDPIRADIQMAYEQGTVQFENLKLMAFFIMGAGEYLTYFFRFNPHSNREDVLKQTLALFFSPLNVKP